MPIASLTHLVRLEAPEGDDYALAFELEIGEVEDDELRVTKGAG